MDFKISMTNILVIGDVMLDTYYGGIVNRISPEAPVPVFRKKSERSVLGGAANVAANLVAANQKVSMMAVLGKDTNGETVLEKFREQGINTDLILQIERPTTTKTRFIAGNNQQVIRLDEEDTDSITNDEEKVLLALLKEKITSFDAIIFSDYMKGLLTYNLTQGIINLAKENNVKVFIDVKGQNFDKYSGAYLLKPNQKELHDLTKLPVDTDEQIVETSEFLREKAKCEYVLTTLGAKGMLLVGEDEMCSVQSVGKEVFDVTGAGDTTIAYLVACAANGMALKDSMEIANYAAGLQVAKMGTSAVYVDEVYDAISSGKEGVIHKLLDYNSVADFRKVHDKKKIVFTNGCFDILHIGHIRYLQEAAKLGDMLIVGLNSDASVKRLKGEERPINNERDRAELLSALSFVDYVVIFEQDTPLELIKMVQPDVLVKGGDYSNEYVVGTNEVEDRGGKLVLIPFVDGKSTTNIINKIKK